MTFNYERARVSLDAYEEQPKQEYVKCVVVGDAAVGKTRLICSYVYDQPGLSISSLYHKPHVPTVFAIDQYVSDPIVRKRAKTTINGVCVQLRIWDTFGDHEKNKKFSFESAHVVVVCYNIGSRSSLRNINATWYPEIKKYCPRVPIILVGTQFDRRYSDPILFNTSSQFTTLTDLLSIGFKGFVCGGSNCKNISQQTCISPEVGRQTAREISAVMYQEASVVTKYGVTEVFENAIKAALVYRRQAKSLFSSHLKHVQDPLMPKPYLPAKLSEPKITPSKLAFNYDYKLLVDKTDLCDVQFLVDHQVILAHSIVLITASPVFRLLLSHPKLLVCLGYEIIPRTMHYENIETSNGYINGIEVSGIPHGFYSIDVKTNCQKMGKISVKVENICPKDFEQIIEFLYTGDMSQVCDWVKLLKATCYLQESVASKYISNIITHEDFNNPIVLNEFHKNQKKTHTLLCKNMFYADVVFLVENVMVPAHKQVLVSQCAMMSAMFRGGSFKESSVQEVEFRDTSVESFQSVLEYLYTGECEEMTDLHGTLQLANFLCLPRLVAMCEEKITRHISEMASSDNKELYSFVIASYIVGQYHNAPQLTAWCKHFMATNYNDLCKDQGKDMKTVLDEETLKYLEENRWPPVWYLKEQDYYERTMRQMMLERDRKKEKKRKRACSGCF